MRGSLARAAVFALLAPLALGGAFGHVDGLEVLSQGTQLFAPDHPAHAPFVPEKEHPCAACAVANFTPPAFATLLLVPPIVGTARETQCAWWAPAPALPELPGRSPPSLTA
ncbi:MAG: hypothetical protein ACHQM4_10185 [Thermoanaerobaculia bacterium]